MTQISTLGITYLLSGNLQAQQTTLAQLNEQLSSGRLYSNLTDYTPTSAKQIVDYQNIITQKTAYLSSIQNVQNRLSVYNSTMTDMESIASSAAALASQNQNYNAATASNIQGLTKSYLLQTADDLNQRFGGRYLYAGTRYTTQPVSNDPTILNGAPQAVVTPNLTNANVTVPAQATSVVNYGGALPGGVANGATLTPASTATVYDASGTSHTLSYSWQKTSSTAWNLTVTSPDDTTFTTVVPFTFDPSTNSLTSASAYSSSAAAPSPYTIGTPTGNGNSADINISLTFPGQSAQSLDLNFGTYGATTGSQSLTLAPTATTLSQTAFTPNGKPVTITVSNTATLPNYDSQYQAKATSLVNYGAALPGAAANGTTLTPTSSKTIYDASGTSHSLNYSWSKTSATNWDLTVTSPDDTTFTTVVPFTFDPTTNALTSASAYSSSAAAPSPYTIGTPTGNGNSADINISLTFPGQTSAQSVDLNFGSYGLTSGSESLTIASGATTLNETTFTQDGKAITTSNPNAYTADTVLIDANYSLTYGVSSNDPSFQKLINGLRYMNAAVTAGQSGDTTTYQADMKQAAILLNSSLTGIQSLNANVANNQNILTQQTTTQNNNISTLTTSLDGLRNADINQVATELTIMQTQLQASYSATGSLLKLSLTQYI